MKKQPIAALPCTDLAATTLSGWGFNLLAFVQLVLIGILLVRLVKQLGTRS